MVFRRLIVAGAALGLLVAMAGPVAAKDPNPDGYTVNTLVTGPSPDADLVNAWGLSRLAGSPWWVADNGTDLSTLYNGDGSKRAAPRVVDPGWRSNRHRLECELGRWRLPRRPVPVQQRGRDDHRMARRPRQHRRGRQRPLWDGAVYKGLAIGTADVGSGPQQYLYATDFHNGKIDVFDNAFADQTWAGAFRDPKLPKGYAPFGIQNLNGMIFVTYAKTQPGSDDEAHGHGRGVVDAFATNGMFLGRVATHGALNAPWGLAWAPADFGRFSNDLLVGNFGDGRITAYRGTATSGTRTVS